MHRRQGQLVAGKVAFVVQYRSFRNDDPPRLVQIWNDAFNGRGAVHLRHSNPLERHALAKPYFDPAGLILAEEDHVPVGFIHAGFGPNEREDAIDPSKGIVCLIAVRPAYRRKGIATELLRRGEAYLDEHGARTIYAGLLRPFNPFYLGLYGGSDLPGILTSDFEAAPFFEHHHYHPLDKCLIFQRRLDDVINIADGRFANFRRQFEMRIMPQVTLNSWWQECTLGLVEPVEFRLEEKANNKLVARATAWEMEGFSWRWNQPTVGIMDLFVRENMRRSGVGKFLLTQILRYLQDQFFGLIEVQVMEQNLPAVQLVRGLGFVQVDVGRLYQKDVEAGAEATAE